MEVSQSTLTIHRNALVLDSLTPLYTLDEPFTEAMIAGGVSAAFLSVASDASWDLMLARTETALEKIEQNPNLVLATTAEGIRSAKIHGQVAMVLVTQSAEMVEKDLRRVSLMYRLGYRVLGLAYTFANFYADGCGERRDSGLTFLGKELIAAVNELPIMLDLSHAGHRASLEAAELARAPCVTHANAYTVNANDRNKKDEVLRLLAKKGSVIGLCGLPRSVRTIDPSLDDMLDHLDHMVKLMGADHVGLGLDYVEAFKRDGVVMPQSRRNRTLRPDIFGSVDDFLHQSYPRDLETIEKLPNLTQRMLDRGYNERDVLAVLGGSWLDAFARHVG